MQEGAVASFGNGRSVLYLSCFDIVDDAETNVRFSIKGAVQFYGASLQRRSTFPQLESLVFKGLSTY